MKEDKNPWMKNEQWNEEIGLLRAIVLKTELVETNKWGGEVYTVNNKNVLGIGSFKNYFALWFFNGVFLKDEAKVLVNANEGVTKALRQWRFTSATEIDEKLILHYINEAIANEKAGLAFKPEKKEAMQCAFFEAELNKNTALKKALEQLTPFKQKEYWEYMATAKQEKTKVTRLEKITPMILEGKGFNDKYRK
ncbi:YdeI/OmpD-associated family protein [Flavobacterium sp.]|uniref:YdeI/OmpD-associated family protein n=1 Tax=Flavobacterium sp. TaxID=239 RepID=UPI00391BBE66